MKPGETFGTACPRGGEIVDYTIGLCSCMECPTPRPDFVPREPETLRGAWPPGPEASAATTKPPPIPAVVRPDWKRPEPPDDSGTWTLTADCAGGDGWDTAWRREREGEDDERSEIGPAADSWPFTEDEARASDFVALGFAVIL